MSFLYGIFHAAGPGHGKAVISSYVIANEETWTRGVVLSFASAFLQALVAVAIVGVAAALLNATAATMTRAVNVIEIVSYSLIILIGVRLLWVKGRGFISTLRTLDGPAAIGAAAATPHHHEHAHAHLHHDCHDHGHGDHHQHHRQHGAGHTHHDDDHASAWGHAHAPEPEQLAGPGGWQRGLSAIVAVGLRPCSGAIIVLVFSLAQGLFWAGIVATFIMGLGTAITVAAIASIAIGAKAWARRFARDTLGLRHARHARHRGGRGGVDHRVRRAAAQRICRERTDGGDVTHAQLRIEQKVDARLRALTATAIAGCDWWSERAASCSADSVHSARDSRREEECRTIAESS